MKSTEVHTVQINRNSTVGNAGYGTHNDSSQKRNTTIGTEKEVSGVIRNNSMSNHTVYYPWNDRVNYDTVCKSIQNILNSFKGPSIIHKGDGGGLGHKFLSLLHSFATALILKRPLSFMMLDTYWNNTDNCMKSMKSVINVTNVRLCNSKMACLSERNQMESLYNETLVFRDYRPAQFTSKNLEKVNSLGLPIKLSSWTHFYSILYRIFANPKKELIDQIVNTTKGVNFRNVTTIHIRSGGALANHKEGTHWVTQEELPNLINMVSSMMNTYHLTRLIYLTTDSNIVDSYLRQHLKNVDFLTLNMYRRDHTTGDSKDESFRAALFDLYVSAQASSILYTPKSGYSMAIRSLSHSKRQYQLQLTMRLKNEVV